MRAALAPLADAPTALAVAAERAVSRAMGGSCSMPLAAFAQWQPHGHLHLRAAWGDEHDPDVRVHAQAQVPVADAAAAEALGQQVADALVAGGARRAQAATEEAPGMTPAQTLDA